MCLAETSMTRPEGPAVFLGVSGSGAVINPRGRVAATNRFHLDSPRGHRGPRMGLSNQPSLLRGHGTRRSSAPQPTVLP
jgi:hypothetical protein